MIGRIGNAPLRQRGLPLGAPIDRREARPVLATERVRYAELAPGRVEIAGRYPRPWGQAEPGRADWPALEAIAGRLGDDRLATGRPEERAMLEAVHEICALRRWVQTALAAISKG